MQVSRFKTIMFSLKLIFKKYNFSLIVFLIMASTAFSQSTLFYDGFVFEHFGIKLNLSDHKIKNFTEDSNGIIWISTFNGLNAFDGESFKLHKEYYNKGNNFKGSFIKNLKEDKEGNLLCLTNKGINFLQKTKTNFEHIDIDSSIILDKNNFIDIVDTSDGEYLFGSKKWIYKFKKVKENKFQFISKQKIVSGKKSSLVQFVKVKNSVLVVSTNNISTYNKPNFKLTVKENIKECIYRNNEIWVLTNKRIGKLNLTAKKIDWLSFQLKSKDDYLINFDVNHNNIMWIGSNKNLIRINLNNKDKLNNTKYIKIGQNEKIFTVFIDSKNNLYVNANNFGFLRLSGKQKNYTYISVPSEFKDGYLSKFLVDKNKNYWFSGANGAHVYDPIKKVFKNFKNGTKTILKGKQITDFVKDNKDNIWLGTSNGVYYYDFEKDKLTAYGRDSILPSYFSHHLKVDKKNNLWYGTQKGVIKIDNTTKKASFYATGRNTSIYIDDLQRLWVSINNYGLAGADITQKTPKRIYLQKKYFKDFRIHSMEIDRNGKFWLAGNNGIIVYDTITKKILKHFNKTNILKDEFFYSLIQDKRGNFWANQNFYKSIYLNADTYKVDGYSPNWMKSFANKRSFFSAINYVDDSGKIFAGSYGGFWVYNPDDIIIDKKPQKVVLTNAKINNQTVYDNFIGNGKLNLDTLNYNQNNIEFNFKTINYKPEFTTNYAYRLKGITNDWQFTKSINKLNFSTLKPNSYSLEIKATNNGIDWSAPKTLVQFKISPPFWKSNLALFLYFIIASSIIYGFYRLLLNKKIAQTESQKLKDVDEFKNKFYENITHEFRTPLTVILGLSNKDKDENSTIIQRNAKQLLNLVNELLSIGKIESSKTKLNYNNINMIQFVKYCMESLESLANEKQISMYFTSNKNEILSITDKDKLQLVLNNLISNAIKFTPKNGVIKVEVNAEKDSILINIIDNGIGIPKKSLEKIFDRFYQISSKDSTKSSGIGLALSREIVKLMDGTLAAKNNTDKGTTFKITLPLLKQNTLIKQNSEINKNIEDSKVILDQENLILVIEDNKDVLLYIDSVLKKDYKIVTAKNGEEGYKKAIEFIPDLIISDVMMPVLNGFEASKLIKKDFRTNHIPIILLTAKADMNSKLAGLELGVDAYLEKPFHQNQLLAQIKNLVSEREKLKEKYLNSINNPSQTADKPQNIFIEKIEKIITENLENVDFSIEFVCEQLGVSRTQLHRKLKATSGLSTSIYIREVRLNHGYQLLINNKELTVSEVAYKVGFNDPNYFTKLFTEKYKNSPSKVKEV